MRSPYAVSSLDLNSLASVYQAGQASPRDIIALVLDRIEAYADPAVWIHLVSRDELLAQAREVEKRRESGDRMPLFGVPFAVKDSVDLAGHPTTAGCPAFSYVPERSATVVERMQAAGAIAIGKTNLDQFGTGLAGDRSPYGACRNVFNSDYISGGSSSGSAVAVAAGLVSFGIATDTAGSGRVPAAANNIVGLKPAPGLLSAAGMVPSCASIDCISFLSLTARDAAILYSIAQGANPSDATWLEASAAGANLASFATPADADLDFGGDEERTARFQKTIERFESNGARRIPIDFGPFREVASLLYDGPWVVERFAALEQFIKAHAGEMHPVTRTIIEGADKYRAVDVFRGSYRLKALREICLRMFDQAEILVVPAFPTLPKLADVLGDSVGWSRRLGTYTNFANLLGLAALAVPDGFTSLGLPSGINLLGLPGSERRLCEIGMHWQRQTGLPLGSTGTKLADIPRPVEASPAPSQPVCGPSAAPEGYVRVSVAGAHLQGQPFHASLCRLGARFVRACRTAAKYRFFAFMNLNPPRPGLLRDEERAGAIAVEVYDLPMEGFGRLVASVAPPLAIGTVDLEDGEAVKGFLCESWETLWARDITDFGGWLSFKGQLARGAGPEKPARCGVSGEKPE